MKAAKFLTILFVTFTQLLFAQTGIIRGTVKDAGTKEEIVGANVFIKGSSQATITDINGRFQLNKVNPGTYTLTVSFISYKTHQIKDIKVAADKVLNLNIMLEEDASELEEVVILGTRQKGTEIAVISEIKQSLQVVSGISSEQIKLSQDRDAAQVMSRIPGITIVENRFVMVRGMPERYNQVLVNNVIAPSTEVDKRTFSFDLIPSSVLDRMLIYKSGAPEAPGDFAGGLVRLFTKSAVEENSTEVMFGMGFRGGTTFNDYYQSKGSPTDFLGFDRSFRVLPKSFPAQVPLQNSGRGSDIRTEAGRSLQNNWEPLRHTAMPDAKAGININRFWKLGEGKVLSATNTFNISQTYQYFTRDFYRYFVWEDRSRPIIPRFEYIDRNYEKENRVGIVSNWFYRKDAYNKIEFKNLFNQLGENTSILREGTELFYRPTDTYRNYLLGYRSRSIYNSQLEGTHNFSNAKSSINWVVGANYIRELEPDLRRFRTFRSKTAPKDAPFQMQLPPSSNLFETGRYFGVMNEVGFSNGINFEKTLGGTEDRPVQIKAGYLVDYKVRNFTSRYFSYLYPGFNDSEAGDSLSKLPLSQIFSPGNIRRDGFTIEEGTRLIDTYDASNLLTSAYVGFVLPYLSVFNFSGGLRIEDNVQKLNAQDDVRLIPVNNPITAILPFLNIDFRITDLTQIRLGYSRTVNRPEFRELAGFLYYDYKLEASREGYRDLETAFIDNLDLRYEFYPRPGETFSIGGFYKRIINPIETRIIIYTDAPGFSYYNADRAICYGAEMEFKKSFNGLTNSSFLEKISINLNASRIFSRVTYFPDSNQSGVQLQQQKRPLQGQSPYIINAGVYYNDAETGWQSSIAYNIFGERIFAIGSYIYPTVFELPRHSIDLTLSKVMGNLVVKFGIQDLLNARYRFYQDSEYTDNVGRDFVNNHRIFTYRRGTLSTISATYKF